MHCNSVLCVVCVCCFFFQAEDGIRDLVRSRGLGDVYKRQVFYMHQGKIGEAVLGNLLDFRIVEYKGAETDLLLGTYFRTLNSPSQAFSFESFILLIGVDYTDSVSYTHLTLPTSDLV